jgi:hypothetical protein
MKMLVARIATAFAVLALATPALPCGAEKTTTTAEKKTEKPAATASVKADQKAAKPATETKTAEVKTSAAKPVQN